MDEARVLVLYGRPDCHLCDVAKAELRPFVERYGLRLEERNVEDSADWERDLGHEIPVGILGGRKLFKYRVDPLALERALRARLG